MRRISIIVMICLATVVFGIRSGNAAEPLIKCGFNPMPIYIGDIIDCSVDIGGTRNFYFYVSNSDKIRLTLTDLTSGSPYPGLYLYDPDGVRVLHMWARDSGAHRDYDVIKTGKYTIVVFENGDNEAMNFRIALQGIIPSPPESRTLCHNTQFDDDIDPFADSDVFIINGNIGDKIKLTLTDLTSGSPYPGLYLYDPDGVRVLHMWARDSGAHRDYDVIKTGKYTSVVFENGENEAMNYRLSFTCILGDCFGCPCFPFEDVCKGDFAYDYIVKIYNKGITTGCSKNPLKYCPSSPVTRAQMAIFLLRSKLGSGYKPPPAKGIFDDVPVGSFADDWIEDLFNRGITTGCEKNPLKYCPSSSITRAQMAVFLVRTFDL